MYVYNQLPSALIRNINSKIQGKFSTIQAFTTCLYTKRKILKGCASDYIHYKFLLSTFLEILHNLKQRVRKFNEKCLEHERKRLMLKFNCCPTSVSCLEATRQLHLVSQLQWRENIERDHHHQAEPWWWIFGCRVS